MRVWVRACVSVCARARARLELSLRTRFCALYFNYYCKTGKPSALYKYKETIVKFKTVHKCYVYIQQHSTSPRTCTLTLTELSFTRSTNIHLTTFSLFRVGLLNKAQWVRLGRVCLARLSGLDYSLACLRGSVGQTRALLAHEAQWVRLHTAYLPLL